MEALVYDGHSARYQAHYPRPVPGPGESLIQVLLAAVCSTDKEVLRGYKQDFRGVMGHEFVGIVLESDRPDLIGKRVVGELNTGCGTCLYCRTQREHHCVARRVPGMSRQDGCFAGYFVQTTRLLHLVPESLPTETAIYTEPLAAALQIAECIHLPPSQPVAVVGDGRLALMTAQALAANGTPVTVFGKHRDKLHRFAPFAQTHLTPKGSFETVVEATGSPGGLATAISLTRSKGTLALKSTYADLAQLNISELVVRELTLVGTRCGPFAPALSLLARGSVILPEISTFPLADFEAAFASPAFKVGFSFHKS